MESQNPFECRVKSIRYEGEYLGINFGDVRAWSYSEVDVRGWWPMSTVFGTVGEQRFMPRNSIPPSG